MLLHCVFYVPTVSITNSIAFANLKDPAREFGPVRVWGTIGWIVASWPFIFILVNWAKVPSMGDVGFVDWLGKALGTSKEGRRSVDRAAVHLPGRRDRVVRAGGVQPDAAAHAAEAGDRRGLAGAAQGRAAAQAPVRRGAVPGHVHRRGRPPELLLLDRVVPQDPAASGIPANWVPPVMKIGQIAEILTMLVLGYVLKSLGWRTTMIVGRARATRRGSRCSRSTPSRGPR